MAGGRPKGSLNKATADVRKAAQRYTTRALTTLANIMDTGESEAARVAAAKELLDRAHGKSTQPIAGDDSAPPVRMEVVRRIVDPPARD